MDAGAPNDGTQDEMRPVGPGPERARWIPLLELADEPVPLRSYLQDGELYGLVDGAGEPQAAILVVDHEPVRAA